LNLKYDESLSKFSFHFNFQLLRLYTMACAVAAYRIAREGGAEIILPWEEGFVLTLPWEEQEAKEVKGMGMETEGEAEVQDSAARGNAGVVAAPAARGVAAEAAVAEAAAVAAVAVAAEQSSSANISDQSNGGAQWDKFNGGADSSGSGRAVDNLADPNLASAADSDAVLVLKLAAASTALSAVVKYGSLEVDFPFEPSVWLAFTLIFGMGLHLSTFPTHLKHLLGDRWGVFVRGCYRVSKNDKKCLR